KTRAAVRLCHGGRSRFGAAPQTGCNGHNPTETAGGGPGVGAAGWVGRYGDPLVHALFESALGGDGSTAAGRAAHGTQPAPGGAKAGATGRTVCAVLAGIDPVEGGFTRVGRDNRN